MSDYYFYHHMVMPLRDIKAAERAIMKHDFERFMKFCEKYPSTKGCVFFPDEAYCRNGRTVNIFDKKNFNKITYTECECG